MLNYYNELLYYIQRLSGDKELSRDLTQETYAKAFQLKIHEKVENKRAYLYKIAKHLVFDESRKKKNYSEIEYTEEYHSVSQEENIEEILQQKDKNKFILKCIKKLPKRNKEAFYLHVIEGYSRKEIAIKMDITISAVEKNIKRATVKIQEELEKEGVNNDY
jgi:RNA polymerase sigma-70 factor (ECF subfamily)